MTASRSLLAGPRRRALTRKLAIELWAVGVAGAILLAIAFILNGPSAFPAQHVRASQDVRLAAPANPELHDFMRRAALPAKASDSSVAVAASAPTVPALSRAAIAPRVDQAKRWTMRTASAHPPAQVTAQPKARPSAMSDVDPWRQVHKAGASAVANLLGEGNSPSSLAKNFPL